MPSSLESLSNHTIVVADTGDFELIQKYHPQDATTNPSLIKQASNLPRYKELLLSAAKYGKNLGTEDRLTLSFEKLCVLFGVEILKMIPGRVSTEVDARLSFDTQATVAAALRVIKLYEENGISKERVLIKISSTWEGIRAAEILEKKHGVHCNLTLLFSLVQAVAAAEAGVTLISPFVGRIYDWYSKKNPDVKYSGSDDPGVLRVKEIYNYYKCHGIKTTVMGASFRTVEQVKALCGCDALTISPSLLEKLKTSDDPVSVELNADLAKSKASPKLDVDEKNFRWLLSQDPVATEKLAEGIRLFHNDTEELKALIEKAQSSL